MTQSVFEIVTYTVTDMARADAARRKAREALSAYPGFIAWTFYATAEADRIFIDHVEWDSLEHAKSAQTRFMTDPVMADFIAVTEQVKAMSHVKQLD